MIKKILFQSLLILILIGCSNNQGLTQKENNVNNTIDKQVDSVLRLMTLKEKIGQMVQYSGRNIKTGPDSNTNEKEKIEKIKNGGIGSMLGVVSVKNTREFQQLVMEHSRLKIPLLFGYDVIHGYKTIFPIPLGESASWDLELIEKSASIAAKETSASGVHWTFAPMIDVSRDARWGRIMEGAGEDPYLVSQIGVARVQGFQGNDLSRENTIAACAKHFAGYGLAEGGRDYNSVNIGKYELNNAVLPPFKAVAKAGVATFMNAFNTLDGIPATGHKGIQRDLLKDKWNWKGFIVSDWGSIGELVPHGFAKDKYQASEIAIKAGSDMDMESYAYENNLEQLVNDGKIDITLIDDAVKRILKLKFELGLFDDPYKYCDEEREKKEVYSIDNQNFAREVAKKSIVLLKNKTQLLPLKKDIKSIAVIGPLANDKNSPIGNWRAQGIANSAVSLLEGIKSAVSPNTKIMYEKGCYLIPNNYKDKETRTSKLSIADTASILKATKAAKNADVVLLAIGENAYQTGEAKSQAEIGFTKAQSKLLKAISKVNNNIIIILMNGRPMDITWAAQNTSAILECWHLGSQAGNAIADVVFGDYNPSGKLPVSFPYNSGQEPFYYNHLNTGRPNNSHDRFFSGYTDMPNEALYPFGYGLSYTTFKYKNLRLDKTKIKKDDSINLSIDVSNTGNVDGEEVVQLYIHDLVGSVTRPVKELKGFEKIMLKAGETKTINFNINDKLLQFYTGNKKWEVEPGDFEVYVGGNSSTTLKTAFTITN
ncbi:beta-glucosidase BglX [Tenacibaculum sp.]|uniref:beta-glucosidase BglX n=1 Tax=Tenacibaculum sp. TaxID=1906242 RepID=UPI003D0F9F16